MRTRCERVAKAMTELWPRTPIAAFDPSTFFTGGSAGFWTSKAMRFMMGTMTWLNSWDDYRMAAKAKAADA